MMDQIVEVSSITENGKIMTARRMNEEEEEAERARQSNSGKRGTKNDVRYQERAEVTPGCGESCL